MRKILLALVVTALIAMLYFKDKFAPFERSPITEEVVEEPPQVTPTPAPQVQPIATPAPQSSERLVAKATPQKLATPTPDPRAWMRNSKTGLRISSLELENNKGKVGLDEKKK